jgi:PIN domain nuclease of toxin-antitoxin system
VRYLVDTHVLIWWWDRSERLPKRVLDVLQGREHEVYISAVAGWEIAMKVRSGKLPSMNDRVHRYVADVVQDGFVHMPVAPDHGVTAGLLDGSHKDPFDRLIAAQAITEDLTVITRDPEIARFGCKVFW